MFQGWGSQVIYQDWCRFRSIRSWIEGKIWLMLEKTIISGFYYLSPCFIFFSRALVAITWRSLENGTPTKTTRVRFGPSTVSGPPTRLWLRRWGLWTSKQTTFVSSCLRTRSTTSRGWTTRRCSQKLSTRSVGKVCKKYIWDVVREGVNCAC